MAGKVADLAPGGYRHGPQGNALERAALASAAHGQSRVGQAPIVIVMTGVYGRTTRKYGERGVRYVHVEAGHAAQNVLLQATTLGLRSGNWGQTPFTCQRFFLGNSSRRTPVT